MTKLVWVGDYEAAGSPGTKPRRRHLEDCSHFYEPSSPRHTPKRLATDEEMETVPPCRTCRDREAEATDAATSGPRRKPGKPAARKIALREPDASRATKRPTLGDLDRHLDR